MVECSFGMACSYIQILYEATKIIILNVIKYMIIVFILMNIDKLFGLVLRIWLQFLVFLNLFKFVVQSFSISQRSRLIHVSITAFLLCLAKL